MKEKKEKRQTCSKRLEDAEVREGLAEKSRGLCQPPWYQTVCAVWSCTVRGGSTASLLAHTPRVETLHAHHLRGGRGEEEEEEEEEEGGGRGGESWHRKHSV
eukprot:1661427-Rhodomonas_salina.1